MMCSTSIPMPICLMNCTMKDNRHLAKSPVHRGLTWRPAGISAGRARLSDPWCSIAAHPKPHGVD